MTLVTTVTLVWLSHELLVNSETCLYIQSFVRSKLTWCAEKTLSFKKWGSQLWL